MNFYLTYDEYHDMGGTLDMTAFNDLVFDAQSTIDWYTFRRLKKETEIPEEVKYCMYKLISLLDDLKKASAIDIATQEDSSLAGISSQSNDGVSVSYNVISAQDAIALNKDALKNCVQKYLSGVTDSLGRNLLYRGLYAGE